MSLRDHFQIIQELEEFAGLSAAEQRYIRRSLDVAFGRDEAIDQWAQGIVEAAAIGRQAKANELLDEIKITDARESSPTTQSGRFRRSSAFRHSTSNKES